MKVYNPMYKNLIINYIASSCLITLIFGLNFFNNYNIYLIESLFKALFFISFGFFVVVAIQFKTIIICEDKIIISGLIFKSRKSIFFKDVNSVKECRYPIRAGLDHLLIISPKRVIRIFCNYVTNYNELYSEVMRLSPSRAQYEDS